MRLQVSESQTNGLGNDPLPLYGQKYPTCLQLILRIQVLPPWWILVIWHYIGFHDLHPGTARLKSSHRWHERQTKNNIQKKKIGRKIQWLQKFLLWCLLQIISIILVTLDCRSKRMHNLSLKSSKQRLAQTQSQHKNGGGTNSLQH